MVLKNKINYSFSHIAKDLNIYLLLFVLISLSTGPLLPELGIISIIFFFIYKKLYLNLNNKTKIIFYIFLLFYLIINISNLSIITEKISSYKVSFFYFRFLIYILFINLLYFQNTFNNNKYLIFVYFYLFIILDGIFQYYFGFNFFGIEKQGYKISGVFGDDQILGSFLVKLLPLVLFFIINSSIEKNYKFTLSITTIILSIITVIISNEFNSILLMLLFILLYVPIIIKKKFKLFLGLIIILFAFTQISALKDQKDRVLSVYNNVTSEQSSIIDSYGSMIKTSILIWQENKYLGAGIKSYKHLSQKEKYKVSIYSTEVHPHNYYFQLLAETGLIGFSFLLILILLASIHFTLSFKEIFKNINFNNNYMISKNLISAGLFINIFPFVPTGNFFNNWLSVIIFTYIGLFSAIILDKKKN